MVDMDVGRRVRRNTDAVPQGNKQVEEELAQLGTLLVAASVAGVRHPLGKAPPLPVRLLGVG